jgi:predicted Zn-dependent protease
VAVAALERHLYERTLQSVWWRLFVPAVASSDAHARSANARTGGNSKSEDDSSALSRWQEALEAMRATLCPLSLAQVNRHTDLSKCSLHSFVYLYAPFQ